MDDSDFYLIHNVCELNIDDYLDPRHGIMDYLLAQKEAGRIRHLGFSAHGSREVIQRFLDAYGEHMEFCQLQINWVDWDFQNAKGKVALLDSLHIPVWVMEPLRGGKLTHLPEEEMAKLQALRPGESAREWSFHFVQSLPSVVVTLSGMSSLAQMEENIRTYHEDKPLSVQEKEALLGVAADMRKKTTLPCTACQYCTTHCPQGLDIPALLAVYNEHRFTGGGFIAPMVLAALPENKRPSACLGCRSCEAVCPQQIKISEAMADFAAKLHR